LSKIVDDNKTLPQALLPLRAAYKKLKARSKRNGTLRLCIHGNAHENVSS